MEEKVCFMILSLFRASIDQNQYQLYSGKNGTFTSLTSLQ